MPFLRASNGLKHPVSPARVALAITQAYEQALGQGVIKQRRQIQNQAMQAWERAEQALGQGEFDEWNERDLWKLVVDVLREQGTGLVADLFHDAHLAKAPAAAAGWHGFEGRDPSLDPKWMVRWPALVLPAPAPQTPAQFPWDPPAEPAPEQARAVFVPLTRGEWKRFWEREARLVSPQPDVETWFKQDLDDERDQKTLDDEGWWSFWVARLEAHLSTDPRMAGVLARMVWRQSLAKASGESWLSGTPGRPDSKLTLEDPQRYKAAALIHLRQVRTQAGWKLSERELAELCEMLHPERDRRLSWSSWATMRQQAALWPLKNQGKAGALELPQWMWLRTALALCQGEAGFADRVRESYDAFSLGRIVPSEAMMRQAGQADPQFLEDQAGWVEDDFERIWSAIHRAAVDTKWNGTVALDWSRVRPKGSTAAAGRKSTGVVGFLRAISMALSAQGRSDHERPVTALLPLWHGDIVHLMDAVDHVPHIQPVLAIPDLFFRRLREQGSWVLFDPSVFPEVLQGDRGILEAEARLETLRQADPKVMGARVVRAQSLWGKLLRFVATHAPSLVFPSSVQAFSPYTAPLGSIMGRDGIGALPLPLQGEVSSTRWPALAINLAALVDGEGHPDRNLMQVTSELALRLLDNAIEASSQTEEAVTQSRPVCMGLIGLYETLARITQDEHDPALTAQWMENIAKVWNTCTEQADRLLAQERGGVALWGQGGAARPSPHEAIERLRQWREGELSLVARDQEGQAQAYPTRFAVRTLWAPFLTLARMAGVTPGGFGTLHPVDTFEDENGMHVAPSAFLLQALRTGTVTPEQAGKIMAFPYLPQRWPKPLRAIVYPEQEQWRIRLHQVAALRPHSDQGVSLSLPHHLDKPLCAYLIHQAWRLGLSNVLFVVQRRQDGDSREGDESLDGEAESAAA